MFVGKLNKHLRELWNAPINRLAGFLSGLVLKIYNAKLVIKKQCSQFSRLISMVSVKLDFTTTSLKVSGDVLKSKAGRGLWMITMLKLFIRNYFDYSVFFSHK